LSKEKGFRGEKEKKKKLGQKGADDREKKKKKRLKVGQQRKREERIIISEVKGEDGKSLQKKRRKNYRKGKKSRFKPPLMEYKAVAEGETTSRVQRI